MRTTLLTVTTVLTLIAGPLLAQDEPADRQGEPAAPSVGKPAPTFRVNDHEGKATTIGGTTDRWTILAFYPKAATPG